MKGARQLESPEKQVDEKEVRNSLQPTPVP
jgi:hypothetical protein